ncbi:MAG: porin family protein [Chitinophagaceae bacterium]
MKTKLILTAATLMLTSATVFSQSKTSQQKTTFGVDGGVNFYSLTGKDQNGDKLKYKLKTGFNIGVNAEIPIGIDFYVQPGVMFIMKGGAERYGADAKVNIGYVQVPVNFLYKPELGTGKLILGFGPYVAFGVGGSYKPSGGDKADVKFKNDVTNAEFLSGDVYVKGVDAGANLLFGYEFASKFSVQLDASLGMINMGPKIDGNDYGEFSSKNTGFGVSVGYRF